MRFIAANPPIEQAGDTIRIGHIDDPKYRNVSVSYEIEVPADTRLQARTGSGDQSVAGIRGPSQLSTGSGGISAANLGDTLEARTGSGDIEMVDIRGAVEVSTGSGSIREGPSLAPSMPAPEAAASGFSRRLPVRCR